MIRVTDSAFLDKDELEWSFMKSSGPGGQNVNKVSTAVQLRFDAARSKSLNEEVRGRLIALAGRKATSQGVIIIDARRHRTQERNRRDALDRLVELVRCAAREQRTRKPTRPPSRAERRRVERKRRRGAVKRMRGRVRDTDE